MRYRNTGKEKENGIVYTPPDLADYIAAEILNYTQTIPQKELSVLDPAIGQGELVLAWVPQNPDAWKHRKIVFRDISEHPQFWLDETGAVVNGDCYWIDIKPDIIDDIIYLALAIANSSFIEKYYDIKFNTRLYSGKRRYMSQYVERFPIPYYKTELSQKAIRLVKKIIAENNHKTDSSDYIELNNTIDRIFV